MSFWLDEEEEVVDGGDDDDDNDDFGSPLAALRSGISSSTRTKKSQSESQASLLSQQQDSAAAAAASQQCCDVCGSTEFYDDDDGGQFPVCANCNTQSQQQLSQELEYEDAVELGARRSFGGFVHAKLPAAASAAEKKKRAEAQSQLWRKPFEDNSVPLPDLVSCVRAFSTVLEGSVERIAELQNWNACGDEDGGGDDSNFDNQTRIRINTNVVKTKVRNLWKSYVQSWGDGAEHYGTLHPQVRFSLRDAFITHPQHRAMIMNAVSYNAIQKEKQKGDAGVGDNGSTEKDRAITVKRASSAVSKKRKRKKGDTELNADGAGAEVDADHNDADDGETGKPAKVRHRGLMYQVVERHLSKGKQQLTHREAALMLVPSMNAAAAFLYLAIFQYGVVTSYQLCEWIATGHVPLTNAFSALLSSEQQRKLSPIQYFFKMDTAIPKPPDLEKLATQLAIACRMKNSPLLVRPIKPRRRTGVEQSTVRYVNERTAPIVAAQVVADLGLGQAALDRSLALMGYIEPRGDFPKPLPKADPKTLSRLMDIVSVVTIACFSDPGWKNWTYHLRRSHLQRTKLDRFVPTNEEHFKLLGYGPMLEGYLCFTQETVLDEQNSVMADVLSKASGTYENDEGLIGSLRKQEPDKEGDDHERLSVPAYSVAAGAAASIVKSAPLDVFRSQSSRQLYQGQSDPARQRLLVEYVAYGTHLEPNKLQASVDEMLK